MAEPTLNYLTAGHACAATPAADCTVATGSGTAATAAQAGACFAATGPAVYAGAEAAMSHLSL